MSYIQLSLVVALTTLCPLTSTDVISVQWFVDEESPSETLIGDLRLALRSQLDADLLRHSMFNLLHRPNQNLSGFAIDRGHLLMTTATALDRETLCPHSRPVDCIVDLNVGLIRFSQLERLINVKVLILDVNDNAPVFTQPQYEVRISELSPPGTTIPLPVATDLDSPQFAVKTYVLRSNFPEFQLRLSNMSQGTGEGGVGGGGGVTAFSSSPTPLLTLTKRLRLDPEPYSLRLEAIDWGTPPKSGSTVVIVTVEDVNDHAPTFDRQTAQVKVSEGHPLDSAIYRLIARDGDRGMNADISYVFAPGTNLFHGHTFRLDRSTGEIFLRKALDFEIENSYQLDVMAIDSGSEPKTGHQTVIIQVDDVNDNAPQLTFNTLSSGDPFRSGDDPSDPDPSRGSAWVQENAPVGSFVAHVSVYDADSGANGQVSCLLIDDTGHFSLDLMAAGQYKLTTLADIDYEANQAFVVTVECSDNGHRQRLTRRQNVTIGVIDVNDNTPEFSEVHFSVTIEENNLPDASILQVRATDRDSGVNSQLNYSIVDHPFALQYVTVDRATGLVRAIAVLDHEDVQSFDFTIGVVDSGLPVRSSSVQVTINIEDVNDEEPVFIEDSYDFLLPENSPAGTVVGIVSAVDRDSPPFNQIVYKIVDAFSSDAIQMFSIDPRSGQIVAKRSFDRERSEEFSWTVSAIDEDNPSLRSEVIVRIRIDDVNDNSPVIVYPSDHHLKQQQPSPSFTSISPASSAWRVSLEPSSSSSSSFSSSSSSTSITPTGRTNSSLLFSVSSAVPRGFVLLKVIAKDDDAGTNARLTYALTTANHLFSIDPATGVLSTKADLRSISYAQHLVRITVQDAGHPPRTTSTDVTIVIDSAISFEDNDASATGGAGGSQQPTLLSRKPEREREEDKEEEEDQESNHLFIVIAVSCVTAAVLILLVVLVVAVKLFERRSQPSAVYHCREQERKVMDKMAAKKEDDDDDEEEDATTNECSLRPTTDSNHSINSQRTKDDRNGDNNAQRSAAAKGGAGKKERGGERCRANNDFVASMERKLLKELRDCDVIVIDAENSSMTDVSGDSGLGASEEIDRLAIDGLHYHHQHHHHQPSTPDAAMNWIDIGAQYSYSLPRNGCTTVAGTAAAVPYMASTFKGVPHSTTQIPLGASPYYKLGGGEERGGSKQWIHKTSFGGRWDGGVGEEGGGQKDDVIYLCGTQQQTPLALLTGGNIKGHQRRRQEDRNTSESLMDEIRRFKTRMAKLPVHSSVLRDQNPRECQAPTAPYAEDDRAEEEEEEMEEGSDHGQYLRWMQAKHETMAS